MLALLVASSDLTQAQACHEMRSFAALQSGSFKFREKKLAIYVLHNVPAALAQTLLDTAGQHSTINHLQILQHASKKLQRDFETTYGR